MIDKYQKLVGKLVVDRVKVNEPLSRHTTFKIGGPADLFYEASSREDLIKVIRVIREVEVPDFILGGGSNILVGDKGFRGIVIKIQNSKIKIQNDNAKCKIYAEAGVKVSVLLEELVKNSAAGFEFMAGIPGTIGGAVRGNAGAWQQNIGGLVKRVKILSAGGKVIWIDKKNCSFKYRDSRFKHNDEIILAVEFILSLGQKEEIDKKINNYLNERSIQPKEPSAGCVFVNPKPHSAGRLIEECGLKGKQIGGAKISEKHANFFVNVGGAMASEVVALIVLAKQKVKEKFDIDLKEEIVRVGEF